MNHPVYVAGCPDYEKDHVKAAVERIFTELQLDDLIHPNMNVVIKPNLVMKSKPEAAIITHPAIVAAVGKRVKALGANVTIAESAGGLYNTPALKSTYSGCGYEAMAERTGLRLNMDCGYGNMECPEGLRCKSSTPFGTAICSSTLPS